MSDSFKTKGEMLSRRAALENGALILGAAALGRFATPQLLAEGIASAPPLVRMGLITDIHYADKPEGKTRYYRESLGKTKEAVTQFNADRIECVMELGDLIDAGETVEQELQYLTAIEAELAQFQGERHYVLGNHDAWSLTKKQFLERCGAKDEFYSFDLHGVHFVVLDACYRSDGVAYGQKNFKWNDCDIPVAQQEWLKTDLKRAQKPAVIFVHQRLDMTGDYAVKSAPAVRAILEASKNVLAVFQGHSHKNDYHEIGGIHYCTLRAVIEGSGPENNGYAELAIFPNNTIRLAGFREQVKREWTC